MKTAYGLVNVEFVAFDLETTGLTPVVDRIVEVGAVRVRGGKVVDTFQELVDPGTPISPGATAVNGITDRMVLGKPGIGEILPRFLEFLGDGLPVAHNAPFDVGFLAYDISRLKLNATDRPVLDTCSLAKRIFPGLPSYSLENLATSLRISSDIFHRAVADARVCMEILLRCMSQFELRNRSGLDELIALNGTSLTLKSGEVILERRLHPLKQAIERGSPLEILYRDARGALTSREITPLGLGVFRGTAMMEAFCHLRQSNRHFRLDRIVEIR